MNKVLESIKPVIENSQDVLIDEKMISRILTLFSRQNLKSINWKEEVLKNATEKEIVNYIFIINSINFLYWGDPKWTIEYNNKYYDGGYALNFCFFKAWENGIPILDAQYLSKLTKEEFAEITKGNVEIPLLLERVKILNQVGQILNQKYDGHFENLIKKTECSVMRALDFLTKDFDTYNDFSLYNKKPVYFYKKAQLALGNLYKYFGGKGIGRFDDIDELTIYADYKVPQILRELGVLRYSEKLARKIDQNILIGKGSQEEVEIRANTIWAGEVIKQKLVGILPDIDAADIDYTLWLTSQNKSLIKNPYHLTETIFY